jgi:hypothetical protein
MSAQYNRTEKTLIAVAIMGLAAYPIFLLWYAIGYSSSHGHHCITECRDCSGIVLSINASKEITHTRTIRLARDLDTLNLDLPYCDRDEGLWEFVEVGDRIEQEDSSLVVLVTRPNGRELRHFTLGCCEF